jgi:hypothetical protein
MAVMTVVLGLASDSRDLYLMPMMLPLSLLAAQGVACMPATGTRMFSTVARWGLGRFALLLWLGWLALVTAIPSELQTLVLTHQPGFDPRVRWIRLALAVIATLVAAAAMIRRARVASFALTQWAIAATLCWADPDITCPTLLVQGFRTLVWEGARPGDVTELYQLYRHDIAGNRMAAHFPG